MLWIAALPAYLSVHIGGLYGNSESFGDKYLLTKFLWNLTNRFKTIAYLIFRFYKQQVNVAASALLNLTGSRCGWKFWCRMTTSYVYTPNLFQIPLTGCLKLHSSTAPIFGPYLLWPNGGPSRLLLSTCLSYTNASEEFLFCAIQMCTTVLPIRPHRGTTYLDAAYFYRPSSAGCPSVRRSLSRSLMIVSPAKTAESIEMPFGL